MGYTVLHVVRTDKTSLKDEPLIVLKIVNYFLVPNLKNIGSSELLQKGFYLTSHVAFLLKIFPFPR
jgi:hypothetical protein